MSALGQAQALDHPVYSYSAVVVIGCVFKGACATSCTYENNGDLTQASSPVYCVTLDIILISVARQEPSAIQKLFMHLIIFRDLSHSSLRLMLESPE